MRYCPYCMREIEGSWCPDCQKDVETASNGTNLAIGTILDTHYVIGICLGAGGFGVTYLARDRTWGASSRSRSIFHPAGPTEESVHRRSAPFRINSWPMSAGSSSF